MWLCMIASAPLGRATGCIYRYLGFWWLAGARHPSPEATRLCSSGALFSFPRSSVGMHTGL